MYTRILDTAEDLHNLFEANGFYKTQNIFTEELIKGLTRVSHLGIFQQHQLPKWHRRRF